MSDLNFVFSDESKSAEAFIVANQILDLRDTESGAIKISIDMLCKAALHKVVHKIAPGFSEHQVNYILVKMTRKGITEVERGHTNYLLHCEKSASPILLEE